MVFVSVDENSLQGFLLTFMQIFFYGRRHMTLDSNVFASLEIHLIINLKKNYDIRKLTYFNVEIPYLSLYFHAA